MRSLHLQNRINELMSFFVTQVNGSTSMGRTDINKVAETVLIPLFTEVYGYTNLKNLNFAERANYPAVDLGDETARVAIQVTSMTDSEKIKDTLRGFVEDKLYEKFERVIVYILTEKQKKYSGRGYQSIIQGRFLFDQNKDIRDYRDLLSVMPTFQIDKLRRILNILEDNFGDGKNYLLMEVEPTTLLAYLRALLSDTSFRDRQDYYTHTEVTGHILSEREQASARQLKLSPETVAADSQRVERLDVLEGLLKYVAKQHVLLVGQSGSGKSTSLERLIWEEAQKAQAELEQLVREETEEAQADMQVNVPVLVRLRSCTPATTCTPAITVESLILQFLSGHNFLIKDSPVDEVKLEKLLLQGRFLLLLDGLNELREGTRDAFDQFWEKYRRTTPMIFTTRDLDLGKRLRIGKVLKMVELTDSQIREFVQAYLAYLGEQTADEMLRQLSSERLRKFVEIPLLLWMLCHVFAQEGKLPKNLGAAFRDFARIYDREIKADVLHQDCQSWGAEVLQQLAFAMMPQQSPTGLRLELAHHEAEEILTQFLENKKFEKLHDTKAWLQVLLAHHLIQPATADTIEFRHQLLQEYYAAEYLLRQIPHLLKDKHSKEYLKHYYLNYTDWTESIVRIQVVG